MVDMTVYGRVLWAGYRSFEKCLGLIMPAHKRSNPFRTDSRQSCGCQRLTATGGDGLLPVSQSKRIVTCWPRSDMSCPIPLLGSPIPSGWH